MLLQLSSILMCAVKGIACSVRVTSYEARNFGIIT
jgi:hypothetical protein